MILKYIKRFLTSDITRKEAVGVFTVYMCLMAGLVWAYDSSHSGAQVDQAVTIANTIGGATGIIKSDGSNTPSAATAGTDYYAPGAADVALADGGTGASLGDPGANVLIGQENGATALHHVTLGTGFEYVAGTNTLNATGSLSDIVNDTTPQLGGDLDIQTHEIEGISAAEFLVLNTYAGIDPSVDVQAVLGAANNAAIISAIGVYSTSAADLAFEAIDSNDFDPDRLNGDTADDNVIDLELLGVNEATAETTISSDDLIPIYDTSASAMRKMTRGNFIAGIGAGQAIVLDIGDDGGDDTSDLGEIAIIDTGAQDNIFNYAGSDKLIIDTGKPWALATTATTANAGDNATAFFSSGTIEYERGGLEADVSEYAGLVKITGGATFAVTITAAGEALLDDADAATMLATLGIDSAANLETALSLGAYASNILGAADSDALVTLLSLAASDIPDISDTYQTKLTNSAGLYGALSDETGSGGGTPLAVFNYNPTLTGLTMAGNIALGAYEIQSTGNIVLQLGAADGSSYVEVENSSGTTAFRIYDDGTIAQAEQANPYNLFADVNLATEFAIQSYDTTVDQLRFGTTTDQMDSNFTALGYMDVNHLHYDGNINITTGHTFQINDTPLALANISDGTTHSSIHIQGGSGEIDGDLIDIDYAQTNYTPATTGVATDVNHLAAHLEGIDDALGAISGSNLVGLTDVTGADIYTAGYILIADGDSFEIKQVTGHVGLTSGGVTTVTDFALTANADAGDVDITSVDKLEGVDTGLFVDLGADGVFQVSSDGVFHFDIDSETLIMDSAANEIAFSTDTDVDTISFASIGLTTGAANDFSAAATTLGTVSGAIDAGSATSVEIPNSANPTTDAAGEITVDSDDDFIEFYGTASRVVGAVQCESFTIVEPDAIQAINDEVLLKQFVAEAYPHGVTLLSIHVGTDGTDFTDDTLNFEEWANEDDGSPSTVEAIDMTGVDNNEDDGTFSDAAIAADAYLAVDLDDSADDIPMIIITITYVINPGD